jgi:hypothetical protein
MRAFDGRRKRIEATLFFGHDVVLVARTVTSNAPSAGRWVVIWTRGRGAHGPTVTGGVGVAVAVLVGVGVLVGVAVGVAVGMDATTSYAPTSQRADPFPSPSWGRATPR